MATPLTKHFTLEEMTTTSVRGVNNTPTKAERTNLLRTCTDGMEPIREQFGPIHVNSGFRGPAVNKAIGGSKTSAHMKGLACDFIPCVDGITFKEVFEWIINDSDIEYDQLIAEYWRDGGGWIHIGFAVAGKEPRGQVLMIGAWTKGKYAIYDPDLVPDL